VPQPVIRIVLEEEGRAGEPVKPAAAGERKEPEAEGGGLRPVRQESRQPEGEEARETTQRALSVVDQLGQFLTSAVARTLGLPTGLVRAFAEPVMQAFSGPQERAQEEGRPPTPRQVLPPGQGQPPAAKDLLPQGGTQPAGGGGEILDVLPAKGAPGGGGAAAAGEGAAGGVEGLLGGAGEGVMGGLAGAAGAAVPIVGAAVAAAKAISAAGQMVGDAARAAGTTMVSAISNDFGGLTKAVSGGLQSFGDKMELISPLLSAGAKALSGMIDAADMVTRAFLERARQLSQFSGQISVAQGRAEVRGVLADLEEARALEGSLSRMVDAQSSMEMSLRELLLPIKEKLAEILADVMEALGDGFDMLKELKPVVSMMLEITPAVIVIKDFVAGIKVLVDLVKRIAALLGIEFQKKDPDADLISGLLEGLSDAAGSQAPDQGGPALGVP